MNRDPSDLADRPAYPPGVAVFNVLSKRGQPQIWVQQHHGRLTMLDVFAMAIAPSLLYDHAVGRMWACTECGRTSKPPLQARVYSSDEEACRAVWNLAEELLAARPKPPDGDDLADGKLDGGRDPRLRA